LFHDTSVQVSTVSSANISDQLTLSSTISIDKERALVTGRQRVEQCFGGSSRVNRNNHSQGRGSLTKETSNEVLRGLNDTRVKVCPTYEWCAICIKVGVSEDV
jgi:hypothetical protein